VSQAGALFARHGYEGTSVDDLVRGLGIHRGSLYGTFGSKRALYLLVLEKHVSALDAEPPASDDPADLTLLLRAAVERAPVDHEAAALVGRGLRSLQRQLASDIDAAASPTAALAQLLGEHLIRRATGTTLTQEAP
jgi:TetR/AcrR family transcriptional repressor of nem operon